MHVFFRIRKTNLYKRKGETPKLIFGSKWAAMRKFKVQEGRTERRTHKSQTMLQLP